MGAFLLTKCGVKKIGLKNDSVGGMRLLPSKIRVFLPIPAWI
jgi:hypothetical protein